MANQKKEAEEHIEKLFEKADEVWPENKESADRYVELAREIAMKFQIKLGEKKRKFCKHCHSYLKPGENSRVRINKGKITIYCKNCKKRRRIPYKPKKEEENKEKKQKKED